MCMGKWAGVYRTVAGKPHECSIPSFPYASVIRKVIRSTSRIVVYDETQLLLCLGQAAHARGWWRRSKPRLPDRQAAGALRISDWSWKSKQAPCVSEHGAKSPNAGRSRVKLRKVYRIPAAGRAIPNAGKLGYGQPRGIALFERRRLASSLMSLEMSRSSL